MINKDQRIKLTYVSGLRAVVLNEVKKNFQLKVLSESSNSVYVEHVHDLNFYKKLRSVSKVFLVIRDRIYNPLYINNHKSILRDLIEPAIKASENNTFRTFKIYCAGSDSPEVSEIEDYIKETFKLAKDEDADLKIHIIKINGVWEVGLQITPRPLSVREYKVRNMNGAMDPTVAHALNSLCDLENCNSYLNVFSGSATLMIEAGLSYENLGEIIGFDNNKDHLSLSIQNIKKAGLIRKVQVKEADIYDKPNLGKFDVIVSDLPFGMAISKDENLEVLYKTFVDYAQSALKDDGKLGIYTSEFKVFEKVVKDSGLVLQKEIIIKLMTSEEQYLPVKLMIFNLS